MPRVHCTTQLPWCCLGGKFLGITKKTWANAYMALNEDDPAINCFQNLGTTPIPTQLSHGKITPTS